MADLQVNGTLKAKNGGGEYLTTELIAEVGDNFIRLNGGLQVCWGDVEKNTSTLTFPKPFLNTQYKVMLNGNSTSDKTTLILNFLSAIPNSGTTATISSSSYVKQYIAVGRWK